MTLFGRTLLNRHLRPATVVSLILLRFHVVWFLYLTAAAHSSNAGGGADITDRIEQCNTPILVFFHSLRPLQCAHRSYNAIAQSLCRH